MIDAIVGGGVLCLAGIGLAVIIFAILDVCEMLLSRWLD